jgi:hypothetical protein
MLLRQVNAVLDSDSSLKISSWFKKILPFDKLRDSAVSIQSYDLTCAVPYKILLSTVIPGWLWSGMMDDAGMQNIPICRPV